MARLSLIQQHKDILMRMYDKHTTGRCHCKDENLCAMQINNLSGKIQILSDVLDGYYD